MKRPIIVVEDDEDDREFLTHVFRKLQLRRTVMMFKDGMEAFEYLSTKSATEPFLVISDINMPRMNGLELRDSLQKAEHFKLKAIPFVFLTTAKARDKTIGEYLDCMQGFFTKSPVLDELTNTVRKIVEYWEECNLPPTARACA